MKNILAVGALALAIGLNILVFSFTSPVLVKGLPYPTVDRVMDVSMAPPGKPETRGPLTPALYALLRDKTGAAFDAIGVFDQGRTANLAGDASGPAERLNGHQISATGLASLGVTPLLGRLPVRADEQAGATPTMVLGYPLWQRRFAGRADIIGHTAMVDGQATTIIGVMPQGFGLLDNNSDAWFTSGFEPAAGQEFQHNLRGIGRLKPGVTVAQAQAAVKVVLDEYAQTYPTRDKGWTLELTSWETARFGGLKKPLLYALLGVGAILLLVCVSIAVVTRAHNTTPRRFGEVLTGSVGLAIAAGAIATVMVWLWLPSLLAITPSALPRLSDVGFGGREFIFAVVLSVVAGLVIGIVPAIRAERTRTANQGWLGAIVLVLLVAVQAALAFVLIAGAGLALRAVGDLRSRDVGINPAGLLSADVYLPRTPYVTRNISGSGSAEIAEFNPAGAALYDRIHAALKTIPGVVQAAGVGSQPFSNFPFVQYFVGDVEHTPDNQVAAQYLTVTENYFNTMGIRIVRGRDFAPTDTADSPWVVLVNEALAKAQWPTGDAIGQKIALTFQPSDEEPSREIIGVVTDTIPFRGASEVPPLIYVLHRQQALQQRASLEGRRTVMSFIVKTAGDPLALGDALKAQVGKVDATTPVAAIRTVESYLNAGQTSLLLFGETLLGVFAIVALVACALGAYALAVYGVAHRQGVAAVGVFVVVAVVAGIAAGWTGWKRLADVIASFLTNLAIAPSDPMPLVITGGIIAAIAVVALLAGVRGASTARR